MLPGLVDMAKHDAFHLGTILQEAEKTLGRLQGHGIHVRGTDGGGRVVKSHQARTWMAAEGARQPAQLRSGEAATHAAGHVGIQADHQPVAHGHATGRNRCVPPQATPQQVGVVVVARHDQSRAAAGEQLIPKQPVGGPGFILGKVTRQQEEVRICAADGAETLAEPVIAADAAVAAARIRQEMGVRQLRHCPWAGMCQRSERLLALPHLATGSVQLRGVRPRRRSTVKP